MCAAAGIWFAVAVVVAAFDRGEKPTVELAFVEATVLPISWTVRIIHVSTLHPRFVQGSNVKVFPPTRDETVMRRTYVARAVIENRSHRTMLDAERVAAEITFWDERGAKPFPMIRARPSGNAEPWQGQPIPDRVDIGYLKREHFDIALRHGDTDTAYAFNTESYRQGVRAEDPSRALRPGRYTLRIRAKASNSDPVEDWLTLENAKAMSIVRIGRPRLARIRYR